MFKSVDKSKNNLIAFYGDTLTEVSKNRLAEVFGEPHVVGDGKGKYLWVLESEDGKIITIYDWKVGEFKDGSSSVVWNIGNQMMSGGRDVELVTKLKEFIRKAPKKRNNLF